MVSFIRTGSQSKTCSICLDEATSDSVTHDSKHFFHQNCIDAWLERSSCCPVCRMQVKGILPLKQRTIINLEELEELDYNLRRAVSAAIFVWLTLFLSVPPQYFENKLQYECYQIVILPCLSLITGLKVGGLERDEIILIMKIALAATSTIFLLR